MRRTIWSKRIPTLLGILLIVIGIGITSYLVKTGVILTSKAGPSETARNIRISNITDNSFTVSFTTEEAVIGSLNFGKDKNLGHTALDERDEQGILREHKIHYITVKNLDPSSDYYFSITSGSNEFLQNDEPFSLKTAPTAPGSKAFIEKTVKGKIVLPNGDSPNEAIVYLNSDNSQTISELVKDGGSYSISANFLKTEDLSSYFTFSDETIFRLLVVGEGSLKSNAKFNSTESDLPIITLGNDYDFTQSNLETASSSASTSFSSLSPPQTPGKSPQINIPKNNQTFIDQQPKFSGTALPNNTVEITIRSLENIKAQVVTDVYGNWSFRPTAPLSPGSHTISIVTRDASGILRTITQVFTIFESGTQVAQAATPSATPVFTPTPILSATPIPTVIPTTPASPTLAPIATITPVILPIPQPGNSSAILIGLFGIGIAVLGFFILLLSRGTSSL